MTAWTIIYMEFEYTGGQSAKKLNSQFFWKYLYSSCIFLQRTTLESYSAYKKMKLKKDTSEETRNSSEAIKYHVELEFEILIIKFAVSPWCIIVESAISCLAGDNSW